MAATASLRPLGRDRFGYAEARHLLNRAGWGGSPAEIAALAEMGLDAAVDHLVDYERVEDAFSPPRADGHIRRGLTGAERREQMIARQNNDRATLNRLFRERQMREADDRRQMNDLRKWWLSRIIDTPRPLEEKLTLLWHGHFATNYRTVENSYQMLQQNFLFRRGAKNDFARLAASIIRDPAMIRFLNNNANRRDSPNENLARELMELFTLGEGNYTEHDIREGARALTGYTVHNNEFHFAQSQHDPGVKVILGRRGRFNGDGFVQLCLQQRACSQFVCYKLYRHFVSDLPHGMNSHARSVILNLARQLVRDRYRLDNTLKMLFKSEHFYDPQITGNLIKSPTQIVAGTIRALGTPSRDLDVVINAMDAMGQQLFDPPSVKGWEGGRAWINTSTLFARQNLATYLITGQRARQSGGSAPAGPYDPMPLLNNLTSRTPEAVVDHLMSALLGSQVHPSRRDELVRFLDSRDGAINQENLTALLLLLTSLPEYQLC